MSDGLKDQWGVGDPAQAGSDKQSQQFQAAFQKDIAVINDNLQYTAVNAEEARHDPLAARRDAIIAAFQAVIPKIDPADTTKAKAAIDKVLGEEKSLNAEVGKFRKEAEKAFTDWQSRQSKFDDAVQQVEELETWQEPKAPALRTLVDGIRNLVNLRKYAPACATLDQLMPKLKPIYEEYLRQKDAKEKYDPALEQLQPRLEKTQSSAYAKLEPFHKDIDSIKGNMETAAQARDFVQALKLLGDLSDKVDEYQIKSDDLDKHKKDYEDALETIASKAPGPIAPHPKLEPMETENESIRGQMEADASSEDFEEALKQANDLSAKLDLYNAAVKELEDQKEAFDDAYNPLKPRLDKINQSTTAEMAPLQQGIMELKDQIDKLAEAEDYVQALSVVKNLAANLDAYENADKNQLYLIEYPKGKKQYLNAKELADLKIQIALKSIKEVLPPLQIKADTFVNWHRDLKAIADGSYVISSIVNFVGGADLDAVASAVAAQQPKLDTLKQIINSDPAKAQDAYKDAVEAINAAGKAINDYMDKLDKGGKQTITALQVVEVTCFAVGAAAGAAVLAPAGAGLLATAGANAATGAGFGVLQSAVEDGAHNVIMTGEKPISGEDFAKRAALAGVKGAATGALSAAAGRGSTVVVEGVMVKLGCKEAATRVFVKEVVESGMSDAVQKVFDKTPDLVTGKTKWDDVWPEVVEAFIVGGIKGRIIGKMGANEAFGKTKGFGASEVTGEEIDAWANSIGK